MSVFKMSIVQWWLDGHKVPAGTPGAKKVKKRSAKFYGRAPGNRKAIPLSTNKIAAEQLLAEKVKASELGRAGITDPYEAHRRRPLAQHLADWIAVVRARGCTEKHIQMKEAQTTRLIDACRFIFIADLSALIQNLFGHSHSPAFAMCRLQANRVPSKN